MNVKIYVQALLLYIIVFFAAYYYVFLSVIVIPIVFAITIKSDNAGRCGGNSVIGVVVDTYIILVPIQLFMLAVCSIHFHDRIQNILFSSVSASIVYHSMLYGGGIRVEVEKNPKFIQALIVLIGCSFYSSYLSMGRINSISIISEYISMSYFGYDVSGFDPSIISYAIMFYIGISISGLLGTCGFVGVFSWAYFRWRSGLNG